MFGQASLGLVWLGQFRYEGGLQTLFIVEWHSTRSLPIFLQMYLNTKYNDVFKYFCCKYFLKYLHNCILDRIFNSIIQDVNKLHWNITDTHIINFITYYTLFLFLSTSLFHSCFRQTILLAFRRQSRPQWVKELYRSSSDSEADTYVSRCLTKV